MIAIIDISSVGQNLSFYLTISFLGSFFVYLFFFDFIYLITTNVNNPNQSSSEEKATIWLISLIISFSAMTTLVYMSSFFVQETSFKSRVVSKHSQFRRGVYVGAIIVLKNKNFFVETSKKEALLVSVGDIINLNYRDSLLGVRFIDTIKVLDGPMVRNKGDRAR